MSLDSRTARIRALAADGAHGLRSRLDAFLDTPAAAKRRSPRGSRRVRLSRIDARARSRTAHGAGSADESHTALLRAPRLSQAPRLSPRADGDRDMHGAVLAAQVARPAYATQGSQSGARERTYAVRVAGREVRYTDRGAALAALDACEAAGLDAVLAEVR